MNTANLQLAGLYAAIAAITDALREKGLLTTDEIDRALARAAAAVQHDPRRPAELSPANVEAICFPLRYLRAANRAASEGAQPSFTEITSQIGRMKPDR